MDWSFAKLCIAFQQARSFSPFKKMPDTFLLSLCSFGLILSYFVKEENGLLTAPKMEEETSLESIEIER
jgi:hypothetical protein